MDRGKAGNGNGKDSRRKRLCAKSKVVSYRLKCARTANGLSHFIMYGDVPKGKSPL